jgi:hypothetical protein
MSEQPDEKASRRRGSALEEAILDAAWDVLETDGWGGFTFGRVAERAQSSKPAHPGGAAAGHPAPPGRDEPQRQARHRQPPR